MPCARERRTDTGTGQNERRHLPPLPRRTLTFTRTTRTTAPTSSMRAHRSMANMLSSRCGAPPPSSLSPDVPPLPLPRRSDDSVKSSTSTGSPSSASASSGTPSTFLDRMKGCGGYGIVYGYGNEYGLSRTNVEEEPELGSEEGREWGGGWLPCPSRSGAYFRAARWLSPLMDEVLIMVCFGKRIRRRLVAWRPVRSRRDTLATRRNCREHSNYTHFKGMGIWHLCASGQACVIISSFRAPMD